MAGPCLPRPHGPPIFLVPALLFFIMLISAAYSADVDALLAFKSALSGGDAALSDWKASVSPCKGDDPVWTGVLCTGGSVMGLQLENMKLSGPLKLDALVGLQGLRTLSFMNNAFEGIMPELDKFGALKSLYLSSNKLAGPIPDDAFAGMGSLKKVYLSQNRFEGPIPKSLTGLPRLLELALDGNAFTGAIPDLRQKELKLVNVSNNQLEGPIPEGLSKMDASMFAGNKGLCGPPLNGSACSNTTVPADPAPAPGKKPSVPLLATIVAIAVGVGLSVIGAILAVVRRQREEQMQQLGRMQSSKNPGNYPTKRGTSLMEAEGGRMGRAPSSRQNPRNIKAVDPEKGGSPDESVSGGSVKKNGAGGKSHDQGKLVFVNALKGDRERFELQDLLKASAEILPGGCLGSCYKAILVNGPSVVVKRFKEMNAVGKEDFQEHMSRLGRLSHPNLLPLIAYYYRREEKLLVTEYSQSGSLANLLHGNSGMLDWPARLKIVKGIARGLVYLYESLRMLGLPHGHLKSSNIVLDQSTGEPLLTDYGLAPVMNQAHTAQVMVAYKAPEIRQYGRTTKKSDVWCFGILILEILTGKQGGGTTKGGNEGMDLASWVNSVVREEWTGEVFDGAMKGTKHAEGEMLKLLRIGLACCERDVDKRWEMSEALDRIEELKEREENMRSIGGGTDHEDYSSYLSEGEAYSSRAMSQDDFSFTTNN